MKTQAICVLLGATFCAGASAQTPATWGKAPAAWGQTSVYEMVQTLAAEGEYRFAAMERAKKQAEADRQLEFAKEATQFVASWNKFVASYNEGKLDLAGARALSKEFRDLEKRGGWLSKDKGHEKRETVIACPSEP